MRKHLFWLAVIALVAAILLFTTAFTRAAEQEQVLKVGKKGDISFSTETKVGNLMLKPGRYVVQHRAVGSDHFMQFNQVTERRPLYGTGGGIPKGHPRQAWCGLEPLKSKASKTEVHLTNEEGVMRLTKIVISGENVAHVF